MGGLGDVVVEIQNWPGEVEGWIEDIGEVGAEGGEGGFWCGSRDAVAF